MDLLFAASPLDAWQLSVDTAPHWVSYGREVACVLGPLVGPPAPPVAKTEHTRPACSQ